MRTAIFVHRAGALEQLLPTHLAMGSLTVAHHFVVLRKEQSRHTVPQSLH